jgi:S-formylglutathione hydrolase FrmB
MAGYEARRTTADQTVGAYRGVAVTKSDTTELASTAGLYVGGGGTLVVTMNDGNDVTFVGALAGVIYPYQVTKVKAATTATSIVALYN